MRAAASPTRSEVPSGPLSPPSYRPTGIPSYHGPGPATLVIPFILSLEKLPSRGPPSTSRPSRAPLLARRA
eukprot:8968227-Pyramimonas_sp.AAC.1